MEPGFKAPLELIPERAVERLRGKSWLLGRKEEEDPG
jgi:hypothetical protein